MTCTEIRGWFFRFLNDFWPKLIESLHSISYKFFKFYFGFEGNEHVGAAATEFVEGGFIPPYGHVQQLILCLVCGS